MKVYRIDVQIAGTLYVKATSEKAAREIATDATDMVCLEVEDVCSEIEISGKQYDDPDLPDVSLSPAMTVHGIWPGTGVERADD